MNPTLSIPKNNLHHEMDMCERHNAAFYDPIARVLRYLSVKHAKKRFEKDMEWLLKKHKYSEDGKSRFWHGKLYYTRADLIKEVTSLNGRKFFALLSAFHPVKRLNKLSLLTGDVDYQRSILLRMKADLGNDAVKNACSTLAYCRAFLNPIFDYDAFRDGKTPDCERDGSQFKWIQKDGQIWCCGEFIRELGVKYCVYCNADGIYSFYLKERRPLPYASALDHFLPQHLHPYFALNLHNLIPCCTRCNTSLKGKKDTDLMSYASPYYDDLYAAFKIRMFRGGKEINKVAGGDVSSLEIRYFPQRVDAQGRVEKLMYELFKWEEVYNSIFKQDVLDIFLRIRKLTPSFIKWLRKTGLSGVNDDKLLYGCAMRKSEICRYRFAKVIQDIAERYGGVRLRN